MDQSGLKRGARRPPPTLGGGRYVITQILGKGATAVVYLGFDKKARIWRAIKVLQPQLLGDKEMLARFMLEAQTMRRLKHPNLLRCYDAMEDPYTPFMVMELAPGGSLSRWVKQNGPMPPHLAGEVTIQLCEGLVAAHKAGVIHRDVKPHNVLLNRKGLCKLTDFGIAQVGGEEISMTMTGSTLGTFAFMAPEQRNDSKNVDERADVYAVGASLYMLLKAKVSTELFIAETQDEILRGLPPPLVRVLLRATKYDRSERFADCEALRTDLEAALLEMEPPVGAMPRLVDVRDVLPVRPPDVLPAGVQFKALDEARGLRDEGVTYVPSKEDVELALADDPNPTVLGSDGVPGRLGDLNLTNTPQPDGPAESPSLLPGRLQQAHERSTPQVDRISEMPLYDDISGSGAEELIMPRREWIPPVETKPEPEREGPRQVPIGIVAAATVALFLTLCVGSLGGGAVSVRSSEGRAGTAAESMFATIELESAVAYDLGAARHGAEEAFFQVQDARGEDKVHAALAFIEIVNKHGAGFDPSSPSGIRRENLLQRRAAYTDARRAWERASGGTLGGLAVTLGLASPPPVGTEP